MRGPEPKESGLPISKSGLAIIDLATTCFRDSVLLQGQIDAGLSQQVEMSAVIP